MKEENNIIIDGSSLYELLCRARNAGNFEYGKKRRSDYCEPILNWIMGERLPWDENYSSIFFEFIINHYANFEVKNQLLASSGYGNEYSGLKTTNKRRQLFVVKNNTELSDLEESTLLKRENEDIKNIACLMARDFASGKLQQSVQKLFKREVNLTDNKMQQTDDFTIYTAPNVDGNNAGMHWGDSNGGRMAFTKKQINTGALGESITLNSLLNGKYGDERNFVSAALFDSSEILWYGNEIKVEDKKIM